jgi:hypothetical protein
MRKHSMRNGVACAIAMLAISGRPVSAQGQTSGWPQATVETATKAPKAAVTSKSAPASAPVKPAAAPKAVAKSKSDVPAAAPAAVAVAPVAKPAVTEIVAVEVVQALQQQSELLKRLAMEMDAQRTVIKEQQDKIKALELRAVSPAAPSAAPAAKVAAPPPPPAILVDTSGIKLRVSGLFQGWYSASDAAVVDTFRLRRAELKFSGDISPRLKWAVMVDPAKTLSLSATTGSMGGQTVVTGASVSQSGRILQDAYVQLNWQPSVSLEMGQQKLPLGLEGTTSSGKLDTVERALFMVDKARGAGYADIRDFGVMVRGKVAGGQLEYATGVFNGFGEAFNDIDRNEDKSLVGRLIARPRFVKGLQVGASIGRERFTWSDQTARERQGVDAAYGYGIFGFKGELFGGRDAAVTRQGGYAQVSTRVHKKMTMVARYDTWDPDTRSENTAVTVAERDWLGGFTYVLHPSGVWLQANYIWKTFDGVAPSRSVFTTNVQTAW